MNEVPLPVIVGFIVSMAFQLAKKWKWLECTDATVKQVTVSVVAGVTVLAAAQWKLDQATLLQAVSAAIVALATHKGLLQLPADETAKAPKSKSKECDAK